MNRSSLQVKATMAQRMAWLGQKGAAAQSCDLQAWLMRGRSEARVHCNDDLHDISAGTSIFWAAALSQHVREQTLPRRNGSAHPAHIIKLCNVSEGFLHLRRPLQHGYLLQRKLRHQRDAALSEYALLFVAFLRHILPHLIQPGPLTW